MEPTVVATPAIYVVVNPSLSGASGLTGNATLDAALIGALVTAIGWLALYFANRNLQLAVLDKTNTHAIARAEQDHLAHERLEKLKLKIARREKEVAPILDWAQRALAGFGTLRLHVVNRNQIGANQVWQLVIVGDGVRPMASGPIHSPQLTAAYSAAIQAYWALYNLFPVGTLVTNVDLAELDRLIDEFRRAPLDLERRSEGFIYGE